MHNNNDNATAHRVCGAHRLVVGAVRFRIGNYCCNEPSSVRTSTKPPKNGILVCRHTLTCVRKR
jgi:hypothetical protein